MAAREKPLVAHTNGFPDQETLGAGKRKPGANHRTSYRTGSQAGGRPFFGQLGRVDLRFVVAGGDWGAESLCTAGLLYTARRATAAKGPATICPRAIAPYLWLAGRLDQIGAGVS